ncbi:MAG TPA: EVE domain-containing protein [Candidatus Limnocylindrales bacterium]|nr:EVE domain-containing protein [Candidatus Limnocylindrales bacterium]
MAHWLAKTEPSTYSWQQLVKEKRTRWDGVRNAQARNNLAAMKKGDDVLFYHSGDERAVVGIAKVATAAYADPTTDDERWVCVDLTPAKALASPVTLASIKATPSLKNMALVRQGRLSVTPVTPEEFRAVVALAKPAARKHA